jgi:hypothetical protein
MRSIGPVGGVAIPVSVTNGGTGATTAAGARTALSVPPVADVDASGAVIKLNGNALDSAGTRTALGLGSAATQAIAAFDAAGAAAAAQSASQPLDADLTAMAGAGNSASLVKIGIAESALSDTAGALAWNPNTTPFAYYQQDINISSITLTAPTTTNQIVVIVLEGAGAFTWANSWTNAVMMAGAWTKPVTGQKNAYTLTSTLTAVGQAIWVQIGLAVNLG